MNLFHFEQHQDHPFSDRNIDDFLNNIVYSLARETTQNSGDAAEIWPVKINFDLDEIRVDDIPKLSEFKGIIASCSDVAKLGKDVREQEILSTMKSVLDKQTIKVLSIADYNTSGLGGRFSRGEPFHTLVKTQGTTAKVMQGSGGSFGVGKNAATAASTLRTVFYSTINGSDGKFSCMGKAILRTWDDAEGNLRDRFVFWGDTAKDLEPVVDPSHVKSWLKRDKPGLTTHILAPHHAFGSDWALKLAIVLVENFYTAIHDGSLEFSIDHESIILNSSNLSARFKEYLALDDLRDIAPLKTAHQMHIALTADDSYRETFTIKDVDFDLVMYCSNLKEILSNLVEVQNDEHNKYEYLEHEIQFHSEDYSITKSMLLKTIQEKDGSVRKDRTTSSRNT